MRNRNYFWGIVFILTAVFILLSNFGYPGNPYDTRASGILFLYGVMRRLTGICKCMQRIDHKIKECRRHRVEDDISQRYKKEHKK